jgi:hypothetical protein
MSVYLLDKPTELTARYAVASASMVGLAYIVIVTGNRAACPCLAFNFKGRCRHTSAVLALAPDAAPEPEPAVGSLSWRDVFREAGTDPRTKQPNNHFQGVIP